MNRLQQSHALPNWTVLVVVGVTGTLAPVSIARAVETLAAAPAQPADTPADDPSETSDRSGVLILEHRYDRWDRTPLKPSGVVVSDLTGGFPGICPPPAAMLPARPGGPPVDLPAHPDRGRFLAHRPHAPPACCD